MSQPSIQGASANMTSPSQFREVTAGQVGVVDITSAIGFYTTEIKGLIPSDISYSGSTGTVTFSGTPDLSEVMVGSQIFVSGCDTGNNGYFVITAVDDGSDTIDFTNLNSSFADQSSFDAGAQVEVKPFKGAWKVEALDGSVAFATLVEDNHLGSSFAATMALAINESITGSFSEVTVSAGNARVYLK